MKSSKPIIFLSYSREDRPWLEFIRRHLRVAATAGHFETWDDSRITGQDWEKEINDALSTCAVFILLVSSHSLTSDFILKKEIRAALQAHAARGVRIYPIVVEDCDFKGVPWLIKMNIRPRDLKALESFPPAERNQVMASITAEIRGLLTAQPSAAARASAASAAASAPAAGDAPPGQTAKVRGDGNVVIQVTGSKNTVSTRRRK
jgi:hypothetical protein